MSSNEESDDEFESADEDIAFEPRTDHRLEVKNKDIDVEDVQNDNQRKSGQHLQQIDSQLNLISIEDKKVESLEESKRFEKSSETTKETRRQTQERLDIKKENKLEDVSQNNDLTQIQSKSIIEEDKPTEVFIQKSNESKEKIVIKTRKLLRKADRLMANQDIQTDEEVKKDKEEVREEDKEEIKEEDKEEVKEDKKEVKKVKEEVKIEDKGKEDEIKEDINEDIEIKTKKCENKTEIKTSENLSEIITKTENKGKEKPVIKGRKLLRKADVLKDDIDSQESEISEEKKNEVLNKLSDLSEREDSSSSWNSWFTDIKSAAMTATSTTANHVSQASSKWSLNPKSLLTSAVSITTNVGSGLSSVVENVSSAVDSAIGAPPPEQMAALANKEFVIDKTSESDEQRIDTNKNQSESSLGFGLFDYTLNTLESIGKKTMEVTKNIVVDEKPKTRIKTDKKD